MNCSEVLSGDEFYFKLLQFCLCVRAVEARVQATKICHHERVHSRFSLHCKRQVVLISFHSFPYFCPDVEQARGKEIFQFK